MQAARPFPSRFLASIVTIFTLFMIAAFCLRVRAQGAPQPPAPKAAFVDDWTHHHLVFSDPGTSEDAARKRKLEGWQRVTGDPRYQLQQIKRHLGPRPVMADPDLARRADYSRDGDKDHRKGGNPGAATVTGVKKDWSEVLGGGTSVIGAISTLSLSNITGGTSKINFTGGITASFTASAPAAATGTGSFTGAPTVGQTAAIGGLVLTAATSNATGTATFSGNPGGGDTITIGASTYTFRNSASRCGATANCIMRGGTAAQEAQNLEAAIDNNTALCGHKDSVGYCFYNLTSANASATATVSGSVTTIINYTLTPITFTKVSSIITLSPATGTITAPTNIGCTSASAGTFILGPTSTATLAAYLTGAINACHTSYPAVGITASSSTNVVTLTATVAGTGGSLALVSGLSNFTWAGAALTGGSDGNVSTTTFPYWSVNNYATPAQMATNIATAVNSNTTTSAVLRAIANEPASGEITFTKLFSAGTDTVAPAGFGAFTVSGGGSLGAGIQATIQPNVSPAKYGASLTTASCLDDFVVYPTGQAGSGNAATIVAYNNMYVGSGGCEVADPTVYWAYNTGTGGTATTSPVISMDGTQLAFIQSNGAVASLVLLKWAPSSTNSVTLPATPTLVTAAGFRLCTAPCMATIPFTPGNNDTISAPFYVYGYTALGYDDAIYVGDDIGLLHKFTGVFRGTPAEAASPWPVSLGSAKVSSPVYDANSGYVFVGDLGGTLHSVTSAGVIHGTAAIGDAIADAPLVDSTASAVYAFVTTSGANNTIYRFSTAFINLTTPGSPMTAAVGTGGAGYYLYSGMFDNVYYYSANGTGNLWVAGNTGATTGGILYRVGVSNGNLTGAVSPAATVTGAAHPWPSPLTEFCNGACTASATQTTSGTDYIFFSVNRGNVAGCTNSSGNGCILSYNITNPASPTLSGAQNIATPLTPGCWATGGIAIDNSDTSTTGASQIYFVGLNGTEAGGPNGATSSNCGTSTGLTLNAVQASQSNP